MKYRHSRHLRATALASLVCGALFLGGAGAARAVPLLALGESNNLSRFETTSPEFIQSLTTVTGLQSGEKLLAIDFRPATGQLYGITNFSQLYLISPTTGAATRVGPGSFSPPLNLGSTRGWMIDLGFDFDPVSDRIRVVTGAGQNLRLNPDTGTVASVDTPLAFAAGDQNAGRDAAASACAYTNNFSGATSTTLYAVVNGSGSGSPQTVLVTQGSAGGSPISPDSGQLFTVGDSGLIFIEPTGLDIAADGTAFALFTTTDTANGLYTISLATDGAARIGLLPSFEFLRDIAVVLPNSAPPSGTFQFDAAGYSVNEGERAITFNVIRTGDLSGAAAVELATLDDSAEQKSDYIIARRTLKFAPGETSQSVKILIVDDAYVDPAETFKVLLFDARAGFLPGSPNPVAVTIIDNDPITVLPLPNPIDDPQFFVREQYYDFLNREPDPSGFSFWINQITSCGTDAQCIERKRINVSAAFFLSIEFQQTGMEAYLTQRAIAGLGYVDRYEAFMHDIQALQKDFIFGQPGSEAQLEANKVAFFNDYVARPAFVHDFGGLTNEQYVDTLIFNTRVTFTAAQRDAFVTGLNNLTETRATVLRKIVEYPPFRQFELNRAFVTMEYFGYLRRAPDFLGFQFWLDKLNSFNGDFVRAEMVKAFIRSTEYRRRFGNP
jgi:hypothetical protein